MDQFDFALNTPFPEPSYGIWVTGSILPRQQRYRSRSAQSTFH